MKAYNVEHDKEILNHPCINASIFILLPIIYKWRFLKCTCIKVLDDVYVCVFLVFMSFAKVHVIFIKIQKSNTVLQQNARDKHSIHYTLQ